MYVIECNKFNYINGSKSRRQIWIIGNDIFYTNSFKTDKNTVLNEIKIENLVGIIYGTRGSTFSLVKNCIPWRCITFITRTCSYDFELNDFNNILAIVRLFSHYKHIKIPLTRHIIKFKDWLIKSYKNNTNLNYMYLYNMYNEEKNKKNINVLENNNDNECPICWEKINDNKITLKCSHSYHTNCIDTWLLKNDTCPYCRCKISI